MLDLELEILQLSYWEHFKKAKDIALIYPPEHPLRQELDIVLKDLLEKINQKRGINYE
jgi:hypothetical protein